MERLTTNKETSEMSMCELAYNSCYVKNNNAIYRDFEIDINIRELTIKLLEKHADIPNEFTCDEEFDEFMLDALQYGTDSMLGLIAVFYQKLWAMADLREALNRYEDTRYTPEQVVETTQELAELKKQLPPCKVGDTVYWINNHYRTYGDYKVDEEKVELLIFDGEDWIINMGEPKDGIFGETVFLTREEAEAMLKEMESE